MISSLELAQLCGVSQGTVDRALHNRTGVSEKTREHILAKAEEYGYMPNPTAREVLAGKTKLVVALIPALQSPFFMDMMAAIKNELANDGLRLIISIVNDTEDLMLLLKDFAARRYLAAIIIPPEENINIPKQIEKMNVISLLTPCYGKNSCFISPDEIKIGEVATAYLINKSHKKIVHMTYAQKTTAIMKRVKGYESQMNQNDLSAVVRYDLNEKEIVSFVNDKGVTAFFCHNDWLALSVIRVLEKNGLSVPDDVSVIGVDNSSTFTALYQEITTVEYPLKWLACEVSKAVQGNKRTAQPFTNLKIVERQSVCGKPFCSA